MSCDKCAAQSSVLISRIMLPEDANPAGIVHGGVVMKEIDNAAGVAAVRHTRKICVTASIDRLDFHKPAFIGNLITVRASVNYTAPPLWKSVPGSRQKTCFRAKQATWHRPI